MKLEIGRNTLSVIAAKDSDLSAALDLVHGPQRENFAVVYRCGIPSAWLVSFDIHEVEGDEQEKVDDEILGAIEDLSSEVSHLGFLMRQRIRERTAGAA